MSEPTDQKSSAEQNGSSGASAYAGARARSEVKTQAVRDSLKPLAPGERPTAVTIAAIVAALMAIGNVVIALLTEPSNPDVRTAWMIQTLLISAVLLIAAVGMWRAKYWAVLGFQTLLAMQVLIAAISILVANNIWLVLLFLVLIAFASVLFWFLIRAMARLQMPESPDQIKRRVEQEEAEESDG